VTVELLLAPAGGGKTAHAISRIRGLRASDLLVPVWVVLPNFPQVAAFRRRMACAGGALGVEVGTFYRLYADVLARAGEPAPRLFDPVQHRLLRAIVDRLCEEGRLRYYAPLRDKPGFIRALRTLIQEMKQARVHRDALAAAVADQPPRLTELAAIYAAYQDWLVTSGWTDDEGQGWLAVRALERDPALYADLALLVVDGFDEFNPTQLEVLHLLAGRATETLITLTGDPDRPDRTAHRRFARALSVLTTVLGIEPAPLADRDLRTERRGDKEIRGQRDSLLVPLSPPPLVHLEAHLFESGSTPLPADNAIEFVEAQDRRQEVRAALRWLKARIVQDGMFPRQVALLARDLGPYRPFLEETAAEFGLLLHLAVGADLLSNPAVAALLSLLSLPALDWPRRPVVEALASPYFDWSSILEKTEPEEGSPSIVGEGSLPARLDGVARAGLVIQGLDQWRGAFDRLAQAAPELVLGAAEGAGAAGEEEDVVPSDLPTGEEAAALSRTFERFVARLTPPPRATIRDYVAWVEGLIGDDPELVRSSTAPGDAGSLRIVARSREARGGYGHSFARRDVAALRTFKDVLRGLVLAESLLSSPPPVEAGVGVGVPYARFFDELRGAVEATNYTLPPPEEGGILVAPVFHARGLSFRAVALAGLSEGEFPAAEQEDPLLMERERALLREQGLSMEPRLRGEEVTLFYEAVTCARERLLLCRPYLADDGQGWEPSPYWHHLRLLVEVPLRRVRPEEMSPDEAASPQEFVTAAAHAGVPLVPDGDDGSIGQGWRDALSGAAVVRARLARSPAGPYEGGLAPLAPVLAVRYGPDHVWSSSRLETYAKCPLHFYVAHVLRLEPRVLPQEGFDRLILGSIYHRVLEEVYRQSPSAPLSILTVVAQEVFRHAPDEYGFRPTPLWERQQQEFLRVLEKAVVALEDAREGYEPYAQELPFGLHGNPALALRQPASSTQIRGYIDRVDRAADGSLRVIDYKAGSSRISARELEEGTRLQLPLYALAVRDALGMGPVADGCYWHVGSASPSYLRLKRYEGGVEGAIEVAIGYVGTYVAAVRGGRFAPTPPADGCPDHCPAAGFCWRYRPRGW
jgi:ATP-dependent helicase/nuclease subunit B